jgi:chromosome segregation ATPase
MQPYDEWAVELQVALEAERAELVAAETEHEKALSIVRANTAEKAALAKAFAQLAPQQTASYLAAKRRGYEGTLDEATGTLVRLTNSIAGHRRQIADLEHALEQLQSIAPPDDADASEAA